MDLFDDILLEAPAERARPSAKFAPKVKSKQSLRKEISASEHATSSVDGKNLLVASTPNVTKSIPETNLNNGDNSTAISEDNIHSIFISGKVQEVFSAEFELDPLSSGLLDFGSVDDHKAPKIKPRPRVGNASANASASSSIMMEKYVEFPTWTNEVQYLQSSDDGIGGLNNSTCLPLPTSEILSSTDLSDKFNYMSSSTLFSEDNRNLAGVIASQSELVNAVPSEAAVCSGTAGFCESTAETVDIFSGLKSVDDFLSQRKTEAFTNSVESPTLPDVSQQDVARGKEVANERKKSLRKCKRSVVAGVEDDCGKSSRQLRKQAACEHVKNSNSLIEDDDDELDPPYIYNNIDQLEENDDEDEVDYSSKKKRALTSSKRKYVAKNGKAYKKSKKENGDSEKTTKEPPKKFSRSSRRRKRQVDQALLDDYELGSQPMSIKNIVAVALYKMRQEKKEAKYSTNQSGGDFFHDAGANNEEETFNSDDDGFREEDDQARKKFTSNVPLYNSHSFKDKSPRVKWSKQDTEKFYEALKEFGPDFSMIQQLFPDKARRQILLKFKNEDRHHPLQITDAINSRSSDHRLYKLVIAKLPQISTTNANEEAIEDTTEDMSPGINEEIATTEQDSADVKDQEDPAVYHSPEQSDESDDDLRKWSQYQSII